MNPRKPTEEEKHQLLKYFQADGLMRESETIETFATWYIAVFDDYHVKYSNHKGQRVGYKGKVLIILPPDYLFPEVVEVYIWDEGKITRAA